MVKKKSYNELQGRDFDLRNDDESDYKMFLKN